MERGHRRNLCINIGVQQWLFVDPSNAMPCECGWSVHLDERCTNNQWFPEHNHNERRNDA